MKLPEPQRFAAQLARVAREPAMRCIVKLSRLLLGAAWLVLAIDPGVCFSVRWARCAAAPEQSPSEQPADPKSDAGELTDQQFEPFVPRTPRSEADTDRLEALQLYAAGRLKEQQQQLPAALKFYQRAYRRDPAALTVLKQIIPLAFNLGRSEEAFRYAIRLGEVEPTDPVLLRQLGVHLTGEGKLAEALSFYEKAWRLERDKKEPGVVLLLSQLGKLYLIDGQTAQAADVYLQIVTALENADDYRLDRRARKLLLEDAAKTLDLLGVDLEGANDEAAAHELFGRTFLGAGRIEQAQTAFDRVDKAFSNPAVTAWHRAQLAAARGAKETAIQSLDEYFKAHAVSHAEEPYELLEKLLTEAGRGGELLARLEQLHRDDPKNEALQRFLARRYHQAGELDKAAPLFAALAETEPSVEVYRAQIDIYRRLRDVPALLRTLSTVLSQLRLVDLLGDEGKALLADSALIDEIFAAAEKQIAAKPDELTPEQRAGLGALAVASKRIDRAGELFESAIAAQPEQSAELLKQWGLGLLMRDLPAESAAVLARAPTDETPAAEAQRLYHLAGALEYAGKTDEALAAAREATDLAEANADQLEGAYAMVVARVPWILFHAKRYDGALAEYEKLLARFDGKQDAKGAREIAREARLMLSNLAAIQENFVDAEEWLEQILDESPDDVSASNDLGYIWVDQGKHLERSLRMIEYAVAKAPENGAYRDSLGWAWYRLGNYDKAIDELSKATDLLDEPDGLIFDHLGDALDKAGRADDARAAWEKAVTAFDKQQETEKARITREKIAAAPAKTQ